MKTAPTKPTRPIIPTNFTRNEYSPGFTLHTTYGTASITPTATGWFTYAFVRGTGIGQHFPKLSLALLASLRFREVLTTDLINLAKNPNLIK